MTIAMGRASEERGIFDALDDWLKRDRFVFIGWSGATAISLRLPGIGRLAHRHNLS